MLEKKKKKKKNQSLESYKIQNETSLAWLQAIQTATAIANMHMIKLLAMAAWTEISVASNPGDEVSVDWKASGHAPGRSTRQDLQNESSQSNRNRHGKRFYVEI